jgi:hypothetical protein
MPQACSSAFTDPQFCGSRVPVPLIWNDLWCWVEAFPVVFDLNTERFAGVTRNMLTALTRLHFCFHILIDPAFLCLSRCFETRYLPYFCPFWGYDHGPYFFRNKTGWLEKSCWIFSVTIFRSTDDWESFTCLWFHLNCIFLLGIINFNSFEWMKFLRGNAGWIGMNWVVCHSLVVFVNFFIYILLFPVHFNIIWIKCFDIICVCV